MWLPTANQQAPIWFFYFTMIVPAGIEPWPAIYQLLFRTFTGLLGGVLLEAIT